MIEHLKSFEPPHYEIFIEGKEDEMIQHLENEGYTILKTKSFIAKLLKMVGAK